MMMVLTVTAAVAFVERASASAIKPRKDDAARDRKEVDNGSQYVDINFSLLGQDETQRRRVNFKVDLDNVKRKRGSHAYTW